MYHIAGFFGKRFVSVKKILYENTSYTFREMKKKFYLVPFLLAIYFCSFCQTGFRDKLSTAAMELTKVLVRYDPAYYRISYPGGDIPSGKGVCTDVIIRAYRSIGTDLQKEIHEDMIRNFEKYPHYWGLSKTDPNIDHRRVPNMMMFFTRKGLAKAITDDPKDYLPGDLVCWDLGGGITHIGIVVHLKSDDGKRNLIVHNIGGGQVLADCLFKYPIIGHFYYEK